MRCSRLPAFDGRKLWFVGIGGAVARHVHGECFAVAPGQRVHMGFNPQPGRCSGFEELDTRLGVTGGKRLGRGDHAAPPACPWRSTSCIP